MRRIAMANHVYRRSDKTRAATPNAATAISTVAIPEGVTTPLEKTRFLPDRIPGRLGSSDIWSPRCATNAFKRRTSSATADVSFVVATFERSSACSFVSLLSAEKYSSNSLVWTELFRFPPFLPPPCILDVLIGVCGRTNACRGKRMHGVCKRPQILLTGRVTKPFQLRIGGLSVRLIFDKACLGARRYRHAGGLRRCDPIRRRSGRSPAGFGRHGHGAAFAAIR